MKTVRARTRTPAIYNTTSTSSGGGAAVAATDFLSPRRDRANCSLVFHCSQRLRASTYVSFSPFLSFSRALSLFLSHSPYSPLFLRSRVLYVCVRFSPSHSGCVTVAACASTKLNAGKARREIYSRGMYTVFIVIRGAFSMLGQ